VNWYNLQQETGHWKNQTFIMAQHGINIAPCGEPHHWATARHLPYGITQYYLPPETQVNVCHLKPSKLVLDFTTSEGWKAELTYMYIPRQYNAHRQSPIQILTGPNIEQLCCSRPTHGH